MWNISGSQDPGHRLVPPTNASRGIFLQLLTPLNTSCPKKIFGGKLFFPEKFLLRAAQKTYSQGGGVPQMDRLTDEHRRVPIINATEKNVLLGTVQIKVLCSFH